MIFTAPFVAFGMLRVGWLVTRKENADSPTDAMLHDLLFMSSMLLWAVAGTLIIYFKV